MIKSKNEEAIGNWCRRRWYNGSDYGSNVGKRWGSAKHKFLFGQTIVGQMDANAPEELLICEFDYIVAALESENVFC